MAEVAASPVLAAPVTRAAPAKINLYLHVLRRRADGFHDLDSLVVFADVADRVSVAPAPALSLTLAGAFADGLPADQRNLAWRAAADLARSADIETGAVIELEKNLPVAAGLGGGSADAAATLQALAQLWRLPASGKALSGLAARLGADVPVCLEGRPSFIGGAGETVTPAPALPALALVLVNPGVALATADVFATFAGPCGRPARFHEAPATAGGLAALLAERGNDLEAAAITRAPVIAEVLAALRAQPGCLLARMSGSGASCFAIFAAAATSDLAARALAGQQPHWWVRSTRCGGTA